MQKSNEIVIKEIFYSIQGEGINSGRPAVFIRTCGCNLSCDFCDTDHSDGNPMTINEIVSEVKRFNCSLAVITGGEPLIWPLSVPLAFDLRNELEIEVAFETNGTLYVGGANLFHLTVSPKIGHPVDKMIEFGAKEYKYIVNSATGLYHYGIPVGCSPPPPHLSKSRISLQPCDLKNPEKNKELVDFTVQLCKRYGYRLSLQLHKIISVR